MLQFDENNVITIKHLLLFDENNVITITNLNQFDENSVITITNLNQFDDHLRHRELLLILCKRCCSNSNALQHHILQRSSSYFLLRLMLLTVYICLHILKACLTIVGLGRLPKMCNTKRSNLKFWRMPCTHGWLSYDKAPP